MSAGVKKKTPLAYVTKRVFYDGFSIGKADGEKGKNFLSASLSKNCVCKDGVLSRGVGFQEYTTSGGCEVPLSTLSKEVKQIAPFRFHRGGYSFGESVLVLTKDNNLLIYEENGTELEYIGKCGADTRITFGIDDQNAVYALICCATGVWSYDKNKTLKQVSSNSSCGICLWYADRLFFVQLPYAISYTKPCLPTDAKASTESGKIEIPGSFGKIVGLGALKGFLYVFAERGILRMNVRDGAENFAFTEVGYDGGRIFHNAVISGSGHILFLADDGVYLFDGAKAERICLDLAVKPLKDNQEAYGIFADGVFHMQYTDEYGEKKRICVSSDGATAYFAFVADALSDGGGKGLFVQNKTLKMLSDGGKLPSGESYSFVSKTLFFGLDKKKTLKRLTVYGKGDCVVKVTSGGKEKSFEMRLQNGSASVSVGLMGDAFTLSFVLDKETVLTGVTANVVALKRK